MKAKKCMPKCELMAGNYVSSDFNQENVSSVKPINSHHEEEPNRQKHANSSDIKGGSQRASMCSKSDLNLKHPKGAKCSDIKAESQLVPKSSIRENIHENQTVVHETDNKGPTDNLAAAHGRSDDDSWVATHCRSGNDSWAAALDQYDKRVKNTSLVDGWQRHNTTISTKHGWSMSHRSHSPSHSHGSRGLESSNWEKAVGVFGPKKVANEWDPWDSTSHQANEMGKKMASGFESGGQHRCKDGSKSSNWEKAIGLQTASRSFSSNQGTNGWEPWVAACDHTENWNRMNTNKRTPKCGLMDEKHSSSTGQKIVASLEPGDSHRVKEPKSNQHSMCAKSANFSEFKVGSRHVSKSLISGGICEDQAVAQETGSKEKNDNWLASLHQHNEWLGNTSVHDGRKHHSTVSTKHGWSTSHRSHSPSHSHGSRGLESSNWEKAVGVFGPKKVANEWGPWDSTSHQANERGKKMASGFESGGQHRCKDGSKSSNWEKAIGLQTASRSFSSNQGTNGWEPWVAACDQMQNWNRMNTNKCTPKCGLMDEKHSSSTVGQEIVASLEPGDSHQVKEPNSDQHSMCARHANFSEFKVGSRHVSKSIISGGICKDQAVVQETGSKEKTDNWLASLHQHNEWLGNTSVHDGLKHHPTVSTNHGWSTSHRSHNPSPSHGSRGLESLNWEKAVGVFGPKNVTNEWDPWVSASHQANERGKNMTSGFESRKEGSKSSNWEKAIGLQTASRSFSSNQGTNGWEPWVAACDQTENWNRMNTNKSTPKCDLMDEKHSSSTVGQEIVTSLEPGDSHHVNIVKEPKSDRHSMCANRAKYSEFKVGSRHGSKSLISGHQAVVQEISSKEKTDNWLASLHQHNEWLGNTSVHYGWKHHTTVSTNHGWSTSHSRSHRPSPSHGSRGLESSNWEKAVGVFGPKNVTNEWDPWVSASHQANERDKNMISGFESQGQHRCNISPKHGLNQSKRGWNLSNTIKNGPEGSDKRGQTGAGGSLIPRRGFACNKDDYRSANWDSVPGDLIAKEVGISKTHTWEWGTTLDQADRNMPPDLGMRRQQGCRNSQKGGWNRLKRSRSRSPSPGMKFGSENWNKRVRTGTGASTGRHLKGSQFSDLHEDAARRNFGNFTREVGQIRFEKGRYSSHHSSEEFTYSAEQRDYPRPRDELSHWNMTYHGSDQEKYEQYRNRKPPDHYHGFAKERHHRGSAYYAHEEAPSHGPWSIRDESRQRSHDRRGSTSKQRVEPQRVSGTPCRYFAKGQSCHDQNCKFSHQLEHGHPNNLQHDDVQVHKKNTREGVLFRRDFNSERSQQSPVHNNGLIQQLDHSVVLKGIHEHSSPGHPLNTNDFPSDEQSLQGESAKLCSWPSVSRAVVTNAVAAYVPTHSTTSLTSCILSTGMPPEPAAFSHGDQGFPERSSDKNADSKEKNHCGGLDPRQVELARHTNTQEISVPDYRKECSTHTEAVNRDLQTDEWTRDVIGLRMLKFGLVDLVKDLLKPTWKNGHLSRETHKTIVKKVVDKVVGSLKGPEIPQTQEMVNLYLSHSRSNITDLVLAYIEKYLN